MRLFGMLVAVFLIAGSGGGSSLLAENAGRVSGRVLDAGGHPLADLRVELVRAPAGVILQAALTDGRGAWSFSGVSSGEYVVRMVRRQQATGVAVSMGEAAGVPDVLIVAPSLPRAESALQGSAGGGSGGGGLLKELPAIMLGVSSAVVVAAAAVNTVAVIVDAS